MAKLGDLAQLIRSKNAGPFNLTFDIMFESETAYRRVRDAGVLTVERITRLYNTPAQDVLLIQHDAARAIKISIPRPCIQGARDDGDMYGGQQYGPLVEIDVPDQENGDD
jgi:hypothetical protein